MNRIFQRPFLGPHWFNIVLVLGAFACLFSNQLPGVEFLTQYRIAIAGGYLALGLVGLLLSSNRLLFVSLGCSAAISLYLHEMTYRGVLPSSEVLNIENSTINQVLIERIKSSGSNFVCIRPVTATDDSLLCQQLAGAYLYHSTATRSGGNWSWFSKQLFVGCDTLREVRGER